MARIRKYGGTNVQYSTTRSPGWYLYRRLCSVQYTVLVTYGYEYTYSDTYVHKNNISQSETRNTINKRETP